ncbi:MAG: polyprenol monophosphomannose synthase [Candidatus Levybacteria bacterium]|nr:polyprenol monophosphomannose synthase [Candidatus Levybacteria bacterium]
MIKNAAIIIPTYNAKQHIKKTIDDIFSISPFLNIFVVDDNSPDNTSSEVKLLIKKYKRLQLINRSKKDGRGSAVLEGFRQAKNNKDILYFIEMDADLCHNPEYIPQMIKKCEKSDVVIASRYLPSSRIIGWTIKRKIMSFSMNLFARICLGIPITDYTDGFRCYSRRAVELILSRKISSKGYVVLSEIAYVCYRNNMKFSEIPIDFYFDSTLKSNLDIGVIKEAVKTLILLRIYGKKKYKK